MVAIIVMWEFICGCSCIPKTSYLLYLSNWCLLLCPVRLLLASRDDVKDSANTWSARKDCRVWLPCCSGSFSWGGKTPSMELLWNFWHIQDWFKTWAFLILSMLQKPGKWLDVYFLGVVGLCTLFDNITYLSTSIVGSCWSSQWVVLAARYSYSWWRWWLDTLRPTAEGEVVVNAELCSNTEVHLQFAQIHVVTCSW